MNDVLGIGKKNVDEELPILGLKLDRYLPGDGTFIVDYGKLEYGSVVCQAQKCVLPNCALCLFGMYPLKKGDPFVNCLEKNPEMREDETV